MVMLVSIMLALVPTVFAFNLKKHKKLAKMGNTESQFKIGEYFVKETSTTYEVV